MLITACAAIVSFAAGWWLRRVHFQWQQRRLIRSMQAEIEERRHANLS